VKSLSLRLASTLGVVATLSVACDRRPAEPAPVPLATTPPPTAAPPASSLSDRISRPAAPRVVAIGDLHGDLEATRRAFRLAGAIDANDAWIGGSLVVVQTGDAIDRADEDREVLDLLDRLREAAKKAGGELIALSGNHEIMNAELDFRYVTKKAFVSFADVKGNAPQGIPEHERGRAAAFVPGGMYARRFASQPIFVRVGDAVFVHGGILPKHLTYGLDRMNDEIRAWLLGEKSAPPQVVVSEDGPIWSRAYSNAPTPEDCGRAEKVLSALGAKRMVVGHTPQTGGINQVCGGKVWRIDTGMCRYYGGPTEVLEIKGDAMNVLKGEKAKAPAP
jgi:hypothetical protein